MSSAPTNNDTDIDEERRQKKRRTDDEYQSQLHQQLQGQVFSMGQKLSEVQVGMCKLEQKIEDNDNKHTQSFNRIEANMKSSLEETYKHWREVQDSQKWVKRMSLFIILFLLFLMFEIAMIHPESLLAAIGNTIKAMLAS